MTPEASVTFAARTPPAAEAILGWPDRFVAALKPLLLALRADRASAADREELARHGLLDGTGRPTALAEALAELMVREDWQDRDEFAGLLGECVRGRAVSAVLEVGCSTGRRLRTLGLGAAVRVGLDVDGPAVALGCRLARAENQSVAFHCGSGHALPFPDGSFDLVICRNALTYMHQRTALGELARVLRPGGTLILRFENARFDLQYLRRPGGLRPFLAYARNFACGLGLAALGVQPDPGHLRGGRAFATVRQVRRVLRRAGCTTGRPQEAQNCPRLLGRATQTVLVATKGT